MAAYRSSGPAARRPFVVTPHVVEAGRLRPRLPEVGPCREGSEHACDLRVHHHRERKTGPCFALTVMRCRTHRRSFTLYPPGHVPYGRQAIAPVAPNGVEEHVAPEEDAEPLDRWSSTIFAAALDAARGSAWPRHPQPPEPACWRTQGRTLERLLRLLGLMPEAADHRDVFADALRVETLLLHEHAGRLATSTSHRARGEAIAAVLASAERSGCVLDSLQRAGHLAGSWGPPRLWHPPTGVLRDAAFPLSGTPPP